MSHKPKKYFSSDYQFRYTYSSHFFGGHHLAITNDVPSPTPGTPRRMAAGCNWVRCPEAPPHLSQ